MILSFILFYSVTSFNSTESDSIHRICVSGTDNQENCHSLSPLSIFVRKDDLTRYLIGLQKQSIKNIEISVIESPFSSSDKIEIDLSINKLSFISLLKIRNGEASEEKCQSIKLNKFVSEIPFQTLFLEGINILYDKSSKQGNVVQFKSLVLIQSSFLAFSQSTFNKYEIQKDYLSIISKDLFADSYSLSKSGNSIKTATVSGKYTKFLGFPKYQNSQTELNSKIPKFLKSMKNSENKIEVITNDSTAMTIIPKKDVDSYLKNYLFPIDNNKQPLKSDTRKNSKASDENTYYVNNITICKGKSRTECSPNQTITASDVSIFWDGLEGDNITTNMIFEVLGNQTTYINFNKFNIFYTEFMPNITLLTIKHENASIVLTTNNPDEPVPFITVNPTTNTQYRPKRPRQLNYCVCLQSRFQRCKQSLECSNDGIDIDHYVTGKEESFLDEIADYRTSTSIRLVITHTGTETMNIDFKSFYVEKEITFSSASSDITTQLCLREDKLLNSKHFITRFNRITNVNVDFVFPFISFLIMQNSRLDMNKNCDVSNIFTDAYSIQNIQYKLNVSGVMAINSTSPLQLPSDRIYLQSTSFLFMPTISGFPHIVVNGDADETSSRKDSEDSATPSTGSSSDSSERYIKFSDEDDIYSMTFMLSGFGQSIYVGKTYPSNVNITIDSNSKVSPKAPKDLTYFFFETEPYGMQVQFLRAIPTWMRFTFLSPNEPIPTGTNTANGNNNDYGVSLNLTIDDGSAPINFGNLSGRFDLILMSPSTLEHFVKYGIHEGQPDSEENLYYKVDQISTLTIDFQNNLSSVTFSSNSISYGITKEEPLHLPKIADTFRLTTTSQKISFGLNKTTTVEEIELYLLNKSTEVTFDKTFNDLSSDEAQRINFVHFGNDLTLTSTDSYVPYVNLTDNVTGVLFSGTKDSVEIKTVENAFGIKETRTGPSISVKVSPEIGYVLQEAVLAKKVTFVENPFIFAVSATSLSRYNFDTKVTFVPRSRYGNFTTEQSKKAKSEGKASLLADESSSGDVTLKADGVTFGNNGGISQTSSSGKVSIDANSLSTNKLSSIDSSNFGPNGINVKDSVSIPDSAQVSDVTLGDNSMTLKSADGSTTPTIKGGKDDTTFDVSTNEPEVTLNCNDNTLPNNFKINVGSNTQKVNFDKSWNNVNNPEGVTVNLLNSQTEISTEMLEIPNVNFQVRGNSQNRSQLNIVEHKPSLTGQLGFFIFIGIFAFVLILTLGFAIIGCCHLDKTQKKKKDAEINEEEEEVNEKAAKKKAKAAKKEGEEKAKGEKKKAADEAKQQKAAEKAAKKGEKDAEKAAKKGEKEAQKAAKKAEKADKKAEKADKKAKKGE